MFSLHDPDELANIFGNPEAMRYLGKKGEPMSREETETTLFSIIRHWQRHSFGRWAVVDKESEVLIG